MVKKTAEQIAKYADMFSAMGTEPRLRIMQLLLSAHPDGLVVGEIQEELGYSDSTLSHHLDKLKNEDLVTVQTRKHVPAVHGQHGSFGGTARIPLRRMLHAQQSHRTRGDRSPLQIEDDMEDVWKSKKW